MSITRRVSVTSIIPRCMQETVDLCYDPDDPFAVKVVFRVGEDVTWVFARELLDRGLREHAGIGDVRLWPNEAQLMVFLSSPEGSTLLAFSAFQVSRFLHATYEAVPRNQESIDLDCLVNHLLGGAS